MRGQWDQWTVVQWSVTIVCDITTVTGAWHGLADSQSDMLLSFMIFMILSLIGKRRTCIHLFLLNSIDGMMVTALVVEPMTDPSRNMVHSHIEMPPVQRGLSPYEYFKINQNPSPIWTQVGIVRGRHYCKFIQISAKRSRRKEGKRYTRGDWSCTVSIRENCIKCDITLLSIKMLYLSHTNYDKSLILWLNIKKGWNLYSLTPVKLQPSFWLYNGIYLWISDYSLMR